MPVIPALGKQKQEGYREFKASLVNVVVLGNAGLHGETLCVR